MKKLIEIKSWLDGVVLFSHECENNTIKITLELAVSLGTELNYAKLSYAKLNGAELNYAKLNYAKLNYAELNGAELNGAKLNYAELNGAELNGAELNGAELNGAKLNGAELNYAELNYAKLNYAELNYAELNGAELNGAELNYAIGNGIEINTLLCCKYKITFTKDIIAIGCEQHKISEWESFSDKEISKMDKGALEWWNKWKGFVFMAIELSHNKEIK